MKNIIDIKNIPSNWSEVTVSKYLELVNQLPQLAEDADVAIDDNIALVAVMADVDEEVVEGLSMKDMLTVLNRLGFISKMPEKVKCKYQLKTIEELTYDEFVAYQSMAQHPFQNMVAILQIFIKDKTVDVSQIDMVNANAVFQSLQKSTQKYLTGLKVSLALRLMKQKIKQKVQTLFKMKPVQS